MSSPEAANDRSPAALAGRMPAPPSRAADDAAGALDQRRRVLAGLFAAASGFGILVAFAIAWAYPAASPFVAAGVVVASATALWAAARIGERRVRSDLDRLAGENEKLASRLERLADTAWELRESEERYRSLIDAQGDMIVRRDRAGTVTFVNPAFVRVMGRKRAEMLNRPLDVGPPLAPDLGDAGETTGRDVQLATAAGRRWYAWVDIPMRDEIYSVARDITERKDVERALVDARQRAEAASQAKSRVLATVSHEFRTPLNGILGLTGLLGETQLSPDQATYARAVHSSGEALLALVDDMLDFSRIEAGKLDLRPEATNLETLLQDIAELLAARAHGKGIDIAVSLGPDLPAEAMADPARLRQVLINLAGNGVKFTERGGVTIAAATGEDGRIAFSVSDTGPGIDPADGERLFDEFEQADTALSRRHGGAGLGLAISRRIVRQMGGDIRLTARPGGGSVFSFALDLPAVTPATPSPGLSRRSVLILAGAGAEPPALAGHLAGAGAGVRIARTLTEAAGLAAAAAAAGEGHDAVLVDMRATPDPAAALATIREAAGRAVPAVVLIEPGKRATVDALRASGYDAYLVKPVRRASLTKIVADVTADGARTFRADPGDARPARPLPPRRAAAHLDVLLAEDNAINALLARAVLEGLGHAVTEVHDGAAALAAVKGRAQGFDAILMDLHMPVLDGLAAARAIRAWEAERDLPRAAILAVTADVLPETRAEAERAGINAVLEKPMTPERLRRTLADLTP